VTQRISNQFGGDSEKGSIRLSESFSGLSDSSDFATKIVGRRVRAARKQKDEEKRKRGTPMG
jgi:hypothetical protein